MTHPQVLVLDEVSVSHQLLHEIFESQAAARLSAETARSGRRLSSFYGAEMKDGARLGALSLLMKGESLPAGTKWVGSPLAAVDFVKAAGAK